MVPSPQCGLEGPTHSSSPSPPSPPTVPSKQVSSRRPRSLPCARGHSSWLCVWLAPGHHQHLVRCHLVFLRSPPRTVCQEQPSRPFPRPVGPATSVRPGTLLPQGLPAGSPAARKAGKQESTSPASPLGLLHSALLALALIFTCPHPAPRGHMFLPGGVFTMESPQPLAAVP